MASRRPIGFSPLRALHRYAGLMLDILWAVFFACICTVVAACGTRGNVLVWGTLPYRPFREWSLAMRGAGHESVTVVDGAWFPWSVKEDFDIAVADLVPYGLGFLQQRIKAYCAFIYILEHAKVMHMPMCGGPLHQTLLRRWEAPLLRLAGIRTVCIPLGGESFLSSRMQDLSLRHGFLQTLPAIAREEQLMQKRVTYWTAHADIIVSSHIIEHLGRWDVLTPQPCVIDAVSITPRTHYNTHDGRTGSVKILHAPSRRGYKGTEFILHAIKELQSEGLQIELDLLENVPNATVREHMLAADIFADEVIVAGYGIAALEAMASGISVLCNLDNPAILQVFRRYSFLNECPALSSTPETIKENLRVLVTNPHLRRELGRAGPAFTAKYHSHNAARFLFGTVYEYLEGKDIDLLSLYHPLQSSKPSPLPRVVHPLHENRFSTNT